MPRPMPLLGAACWVLLGWVLLLLAGTRSPGASGATGCCLVGEKGAGTVWGDRGPCEAMP